nr:MAG TPA: hypothetical protein [Caudoviricetes sp.]
MQDKFNGYNRGTRMACLSSPLFTRYKIERRMMWI